MEVGVIRLDTALVVSRVEDGISACVRPDRQPGVRGARNRIVNCGDGAVLIQGWVPARDDAIERINQELARSRQAARPDIEAAARRVVGSASGVAESGPTARQGCVDDQWVAVQALQVALRVIDDRHTARLVGHPKPAVGR